MPWQHNGRDEFAGERVKRTVLQAVLRRVEVQSANGPRGLADADLLRRFAEQHDQAAFTVLVSRHGPLVWAVCRNLLANESDAEDAFQATFLALVQSAQRVRTPAVGPWLHGVAVRVAKMTRRSAARRRRRERRAAITEADSPIAAATWSQLQAAVHEEVGRLSEPLRIAFVLCDLQGKSQAAVAAELGWKLGTLSGRLSLARRQLLERLSKRGVAAGSVVAAVVGGGAETIACAPPILVTKVAALARAGVELGGAASPNLLELARAATEVTMTRTKLFGFALTFTGILVAGFTLLPFGSAQEKKAPPMVPAGQRTTGSPDTGAGSGSGGMAMPGMGGMGPGRSASPAWEYKYVIRVSSRLDDFQKVLSQHANSGWEYVGTETLQVTDADKKTELGNGPILVFKRPTNRVAASGGMSGLSGGGMGIGGSGLGGGMGIGGLSGMGPGSGLAGQPSGFGSMSGSARGKSRTGSDTGVAATGASAVPMGGAPTGQNPVNAGPRRETQVVQLKHVMATSLAKTLQELFGDGTARIVAEQQSNSLLIQSDQGTFEALVKLLHRLDVPPQRKTP